MWYEEPNKVTNDREDRKLEEERIRDLETIGSNVIIRFYRNNVLELKNRCRRSKSTDGNVGILEPHPRRQHWFFNKILFSNLSEDNTITLVKIFMIHNFNLRLFLMWQFLHSRISICLNSYPTKALLYFLLVTFYSLKNELRPKIKKKMFYHKVEQSLVTIEEQDDP